MILQSDPKAAYLAHRDEIDEAIRRTLDSGWYILGQEVQAFEHEFAAYHGIGYAVAVASGTDAIELALRAGGVGPGDTVVTVSHTAVATVAAIERSGAEVALVDIDPHTYTMDPNRLEAAVNEIGVKLKAVVPVHLYGHPVDMAPIVDIAHRHGMLIVEDCAQAHGAEVSGRKVGAWGHTAAFSFYPTKNLGGLGDGGMFITDDSDLADRTRALREYGWQQTYVSAEPGINSRLDELQAAVLRVRLAHLDDDNRRRQTIARDYDQHLDINGVQRPQVRPGCTHVYHQYVVSTPRRDELRDYLKEHEIGSLIHYPMAVHQQPAYANRLTLVGDLTCTETATSEILSLPMYPQLSSRDVRKVTDQVQAWAADRPRCAGQCDHVQVSK